MSKNNSHSLQVETSYRQILSLAGPIFFAVFIPQINFFTNNIFLGHYTADPHAFSAAGITGVYYLIFAAVGFGLNSGLQAIISRRAGENQPHLIGKIFTNGIYIGLILAFMGIVLTYTVTPHVFSLFIYDKVILKKSISFLNIRIWGLVFLYVYLLRNALLVGINQSKYLIVAAIAETFSNIFLDYCLIFGNFGFPEMGFNGAAVASICAEFVGMATIFVVLNKNNIVNSFHLFKDLRWDKTQSGFIFKMSSPLMFQHTISIVSWQIFFLLIEHHGEQALKISNIMRNVFGLFGCFTWAFASATNSIVSNLIGQNKHDSVLNAVKKIITMSTGYSFVVMIFINLFPHYFLSIFGQSEQFIQAAIPTTRIVSIAIFFMSFSAQLLSAVTGSGSTKQTFHIEVVAIVLYLIFIYVVSEILWLPIEITWTSEWLYWICLGSLAYVYLKSNRWRHKII